jgi:hypothetical protein
MLALGVDHRSAPTSVREAPAFDGERLRRGLGALKLGLVQPWVTIFLTVAACPGV